KMKKSSSSSCAASGALAQRHSIRSRRWSMVGILTGTGRNSAFAAEDIAADQVFQAHRRFGFVDQVAVAEQLVEAAGTDLDELLADDALGADGRNGVFLHRHVLVDAHADDGFVGFRVEIDVADRADA